MEYPPAVIDKAQKYEKLLQAVATGQGLAEACAEVGLAVDAKTLVRLQRKYQGGGQRWEGLLDGRFGHDLKATSAIKEWLYERKRQDETLRSTQLVAEIKARFGVEFRSGHINYLLRKEGLTAAPGRPYKRVPETVQETAQTPEAAPSLENAGIFFPGSRERGDGDSREH